MTDDFDIDELLRAANPVNEHDLPAPGGSPHARAVYERITGTDYATGQRVKWQRLRRLRHWRLYLAGIVALTGAGSGIGYAVTNNNQPTIQQAAVCYAVDNINASRTLVAITGLGSIRDCAAAWETGEMAGQPAGPPPPLQACVLPTGPAGVFPDRKATGEVCKALGLAPVLPAPAPVNPPSTTTTAPAAPTKGSTGSTTTATAPATTTTSIPPIAAAANLVAREFLASCVGQAHAEQVMHQALDRYGLTNWKVVVGAPFTTARPCASPSLDETQDTAYIIPVPPNGTSQVTSQGQ